MKNQHASATPHRFAVLATDVVIFTLRDHQLLVRMMKVDRPPFFVNIPGLPGGLIHADETAGTAAKRIIREKAGLRADRLHLEQLFTFSELNRDPRGRVVAVAYSAYIPWDDLSTSERADTGDLWWEDAHVTGPLAYDHRQILDLALERIRSRITYTTLISRLLPHEFTLTLLERAYASILGKKMDKRNFRKKFEKLKLLKNTGRKTSGERWRPAMLYRFKTGEIQDIEIL